MLISTDCDQPKHLGWKFNSVSGASSFYALIVAHGENKNGQAISLHGSGVAIEEGAFAFDTLKFGVPAPAWVLALLSVSSTASQ